jgi:hypothetical protein
LGGIRTVKASFARLSTSPGEEEDESEASETA